MESLKTIAKWHENPVATSAEKRLREKHAVSIAAQKKGVAAFTEKANAQLLVLLKTDKLPAKPETQYPKATQEELGKIRAALKQLENNPPPIVSAMGVTDGNATELPIFVRGNHNTPANTKQPRRFPQVLSDGKPLAGEASGRLALARWIADEKNPLTARVMVNRVWRWHFGRGLVATTDNFGLLGDKPSHPELLDWLRSLPRALVAEVGASRRRAPSLRHTTRITWDRLPSCERAAVNDSFLGAPLLLVVLLDARQLVHVRVLQVVLRGRPQVADRQQDEEVEQVPEAVEDPQPRPPRVEGVGDDDAHLARDPRRRQHDRDDEHVREAAVQQQLRALPPRRQLRERPRQRGEHPPVEERVEQRDGEDEEEAERHRHLRELRDVRGDVAVSYTHLTLPTKA